MKSFYIENRYGSGDGPKYDLSYDYLLFKQDWSGQQSVYFNKEEIDTILGKIDAGEIIIHMSYSTLYCKNEVRLEEVRDKFGCYEVLMPQKA